MSRGYIERGDSSLASFVFCVEECISVRECSKFEEGPNCKVTYSV